MLGGDALRRCLHPLTGLYRLQHEWNQILRVRCAFLGGGTLDDDGDFATHAVCRPLCKFLERATAHFLVELRQFPCHRCPPGGTDDFCRQRKRCGKPVWRFEETGRPLLRRNLFQPFPARAVLPRGEAVEAECADAETGQRKRGRNS